MKERFVNILLDTGAIQSAVNLNYVMRMHIPVRRLEKTDVPFLIGASGEKISIAGKATLTIHIDGETVTYTFLVVRGLTANILCGFDFMKSNRMIK